MPHRYHPLLSLITIWNSLKKVATSNDAPTYRGGITLLKNAAGEAFQDIGKAISDAMQTLTVPLLGNIVAGEPMPVPASDFSYYDPESGIDIARSLLPAHEAEDQLYALRVHGDSMIDAMINDGDIVVMKKTNQAKNGEMVAIWLNDRDETTLKYFYRENGKVRLQPANPPPCSLSSSTTPPALWKCKAKSSWSSASCRKTDAALLQTIITLFSP